MTHRKTHLNAQAHQDQANLHDQTTKIQLNQRNLPKPLHQRSQHNQLIQQLHQSDEASENDHELNQQIDRVFATERKLKNQAATTALPNRLICFASYQYAFTILRTFFEQSHPALSWYYYIVLIFVCCPSIYFRVVLHFFTDMFIRTLLSYVLLII